MRVEARPPLLPRGAARRHVLGRQVGGTVAGRPDAKGDLLGLLRDRSISRRRASSGSMRVTDYGSPRDPYRFDASASWMSVKSAPIVHDTASRSFLRERFAITARTSSQPARTPYVTRMSMARSGTPSRSQVSSSPALTGARPRWAR